MKANDKTNELLEKILEYLVRNEDRIESNEFDIEADLLIENDKKEIEESLKEIQSSFNRIHDKLFTFNNMLIASFLGLSKFPSEKPMFSIWVALFPILNLIFLMFMEQQQMEIHRHSAKRMEWDIREGVKKHGKMISNQNWRSMFSIFTTFSLFIFLVIKILTY